MIYNCILPYIYIYIYTPIPLYPYTPIPICNPHASLINSTFQNYYLGSWVEALELQSQQSQQLSHASTGTTPTTSADTGTPFRWYILGVLVTICTSIASRVVQLCLSVRGSQVCVYVIM